MPTTPTGVFHDQGSPIRHSPRQDIAPLPTTGFCCPVAVNERPGEAATQVRGQALEIGWGRRRRWEPCPGIGRRIARCGCCTN